MALIKRVEFKTEIQRRNRIQVPRLIRWEFRMEPSQILMVRVHFEGDWESRQKFYTHMSKDGRIYIPKLACRLLREANQNQSIVGVLVEVELCPSEGVLDEEDE